VPEARLRSPEAQARGRKLFEANCTLCHGARGDGHGLRSAGLAKPPTNFRSPVWRQQATPRRVFFAIREGLRGTPMPRWKWLGEDAAWDLVAYVLSLDGPSGHSDGASLTLSDDAKVVATEAPSPRADARTSAPKKM